MKNNIFQNVLVATFVVGVLSTINSISAAPIRTTGECGIYDQADIRAMRSSHPSKARLAQLFNSVMNSPWDESRCNFLEGWYSWSREQKAQLINHLLNKGVFSASDVEGWENMIDAPDTSIGG